MSVYELSAGDDAPYRVNAVVEIPQGSRNKVEFDPEDQVFRLDRVLYASVHYPGDYGFIPGTESEDGDALDILVLVEESTFTGCVLTARPVGVLEMVDEEERDEKVLAVPVHDPRFESVRGLEDLPEHLLREVEFFFEVYKELEGKETASFGWRESDHARDVVEEAVDRVEGKRP